MAFGNQYFGWTGGSGGGSGSNITGSGTANYVAKFTAAQVIANSQVFDNGTNIGFGTITPTNYLSVAGDIDRVIGLERHLPVASVGVAGSNFSFSAGGATSGATNKNGGDVYLIGGTSTGTGTSNIYFQTATAGSTPTADNAPTSKGAWLGNGNFGIGTITPSQLLDVRGITQIGDGTATVSQIYLNTTSSERQISFTDSANAGTFGVFTLKLGSVGGLTTFLTTNAAFAMTKDLRFDTSSTANVYCNNASNGITFNGRNDTSAQYGFKIYSSGNIGFGGGSGVTSGTAVIHLPAGTATASTAPLKFTTGTLMSTPEAGAFEFVTGTLYFTLSGTTRSVAYFGNKTVQSLTQSTSTLSWDVSSGQNATVTLTASITTFNLTNPVAGEYYTIKIIQGGSGSYTCALPASPVSKVVNGGGCAITLSTSVGSIDILTAYYDGTNLFWTYGTNFT